MRRVMFIVLVLAVLVSTMAFAPQQSPVCKPWAHLVQGQCQVIQGLVKFSQCPKLPYGDGRISPKFLKPWCR